MTTFDPRFFRAARALIAGLALLLAGCFSPVPPDQALRGPLPPPAPGMARLVFYRSLGYYETQAMPTLYLNGVPAGITQNGAVLYRDVPPGQYTMTLAPSLPYPDQFKTVVARPGDVFYVQIATMPNQGGRWGFSQRDYGDTFVERVVDPITGAQATQGLRLIRG